MSKIKTNLLKATATAVLLLALGNGAALAQPSQALSAMAVQGNAVKFMPAPDAIPAGAEIAVIMGDPNKPGPFVVRLRFPAGYVFPAHRHSVDELVTVLDGTVHFARGETVDRTKGTAIGKHGFNPTPADAAHYLWTERGAVIQIHGMGPFDFTYLNAKDDRRKKG